ncbi:MAG TPA: hypothetical protein VFO89_10075 [Thermoanaerobaculia bacterium]|nr:hypothetical protein [Thermoanaerobaculia bacterium]
MRVTIEIPDNLFRKAKAIAALRDESLRKLICDAIEAHLASASPRRRGDRSGWRSVFGLADPKVVAEVDRFIAADLERFEPSEWR